MEIYLASRFSTIDTVRSVARIIEAEGHHVVSTWHRLGEEVDNLVPRDSRHFPAAERKAAYRDLGELEQADLIILLTENCEQTPGGLWFEMGYAYSTGAHVAILGPKQNVFCYLDDVTHFWNVDNLVTYLRRFQVEAFPVVPDELPENSGTEEVTLP